MPRDVNLFDDEVRAIDVTTAGASAGAPAARTERHFLFVLGPFGPFTRRLAARLRACGARCTRVLLNGGDVLDWGLSHAPLYRGPLAGWNAWLTDLAVQEGVTDVVIYGDTNPYCAEAGRVAVALALRVHVLEQGYFRPFWITLERDGVNGNSLLPRTPNDYRRAAACAPEPTETWLPPLTPPAVWRLAAYHIVLWLMAPAFANFRLPYDYSLPRQAFGHVGRYLRQRLLRRRDRRELARALEGPGQLFLAILQRPGDSQMRLHSPFASVAGFIDVVVASFARHAPPDARLLFKGHPLDHGLEALHKVVGVAARACGVADRVFFAEIGDLRAMTAFAVAAVTVNSTGGLTAIEAGVPTLALGTAIYDLPGLTHQGGLERIWSAPQGPDSEFFAQFRKVVMARTQVCGAYATPRGIDLIVPEAARRLLA